MSPRNSKPDSSVAGTASTRNASLAARSSAAARLLPAIAAVPCPITVTRRIAPDRNRSRIPGGSVSGGSSTSSRPSTSTILPRSVLRNDDGASRISLRRKCGESPRSMSRVVICAWWSSAASTGSGVPSYASARDPAQLTGVRGVDDDHLTARRRGPLGVGRRLAVHAEIRWSSPRRARTARSRRRTCPRRARRTAPARCPRSARNSLPGAAAALAPIATEPSSDATVVRNASAGVRCRCARRRDASAGMTLASVVTSAGNAEALERLEVGVVVDVAVERGRRRTDRGRDRPPPGSAGGRWPRR